MSSKRKNDKVAPDIRDSGCRISEKPAGYVVAEELARIRKALEDIASKLTPQCPQGHLQYTLPPAVYPWNCTPSFPVNWDGTPRIMC